MYNQITSNILKTKHNTKFKVNCSFNHFLGNAPSSWQCTYFSKLHSTPFRPLNPTQDHIPVITLTTTSDRHPLTTTAEAAFPKFYYGINVLKNHYYELYTEIVRSYTNLRSAGLRAGVWVP